MELGTGCLACRNQIGISTVNCWSKCGCFVYRFETVFFRCTVNTWVALEILPFLPLWQRTNELDLARQPYMAVQWLADRWYSSGWHMKIYGFQFAQLRVFFSTLWILAWNSWSTFGSKSAPTFWFSHHTGNARKWAYTIASDGFA